LVNIKEVRSLRRWRRQSGPTPVGKVDTFVVLDDLSSGCK
jgi:hypothetical protein